MTKIFLSRLHFPVTALGPGRRVGIWLQGCSLRCPGCVSADTWATGRGRTTVEQVLMAARPWLQIADGITISGGEPFEQPEALVVLLDRIRSVFAGDVLVYSGYEREEIDGTLARAEGLIDGLITGRFEQGQAQTLPLRGSDNQQLHLLTPLGQSRFAGFVCADRVEANRRLDVMFDEDGSVWFAGVPARDDMARLVQILSTEGCRVSISSDKREK